MKPAESVTQFNAFATEAGVVLADCSPRVGIEQMFLFHKDVKADNCDGPSGDMLLFQWGTYDWGRGKHFELNITRQFIEEGLEDDDAISQLGLTFKFDPSDETDALGAADRWCIEPVELEAFRDFVFSSKPLLTLAESKAKTIELTHGYV